MQTISSNYHKPVKAIFALTVLFLFQATGIKLRAQETESLPWQQRDRQEMKPIEYEYVREADVMWSKNIWRVIDTRQKMNLPFSYPERPLIQVIHEAAKKGDITVYDASVLNADRFVKVLPLAEVQKMGEKNDTMMIIDVENPDIERATPINQPLTWDKIKKYRVKEVWFFDTKNSTMQARIIAIAPVMEDYDANGNYRGDMTMYWVPYASLRNMLAKEEVFNPQSDAQRCSWEDLFEQRRFESYIYKESNVFDRNIQEYASGVDAQLESDRIKQELFEKEHDLWNY
jgi:gliding motility associated protien GldN